MVKKASEVARPIFVLPGFVHEALAYADEKDLLPGAYMILSTPAQLDGTKGMKVVKVGQYERRPDIAAFEQAFQMCECQVEEAR